MSNEKTPLKDTKTQPTHHVLLLGNSPNRMGSNAQSWQSLIDDLWKASRNYTNSDINQNAPFVFQMQALTNIHEAVSADGDDEGKLQEAWDKWYDGMSKLQSGPIHEIIAKYDNLFDQYLTTNYDYALENALKYKVDVKNVDMTVKNARRQHRKVWHIHGEAGNASSIVISLHRYMEALKELQDISSDKVSGTWLEHFLSSEVYICGLNVSYEEYLIWYALQKRFELGKGQRMPVHLYQFVAISDKNAENAELEISAMSRIFETYDVQFHPIRVYDNDYVAAWYQVIGAIHSKILGIQLEKNPNEFKIAYYQKNICASQSATTTNNSRCWFNIGVDKLKSAVEKKVKEWYFD